MARTSMSLEAYVRSLLFVPGDDGKKLAKACQLPADALIIDWEDAVASQRKSEARIRTIEFAAARGTQRQRLFVRVNPVFSPEFKEDCQAIKKITVDGIMLPKCRSAAEVRVLEKTLSSTAALEQCQICPLIELPIALVNVFSISTASDRVAALAFGAEDFSNEMGIVRSEAEIELLYARSCLVTNARATNRDAWDSPCTDFRNPERVRAAGRLARNLGFTGKLAIHPSQLEILNEVFSPSEQELRAARRIVAAASSAAGAFSLEGKMIDAPILKRAQRILQFSSRAGD